MQNEMKIRVIWCYIMKKDKDMQVHKQGKYEPIGPRIESTTFSIENWHSYC